MLYEVTPLARPPPRIVPLPVMVDPMEGEAFISCCHRLGARLSLSPGQTACMLGAVASDSAACRQSWFSQWHFGARLDAHHNAQKALSESGWQVRFARTKPDES
jgi:hypothetical protein